MKFFKLKFMQDYRGLLAVDDDLFSDLYHEGRFDEAAKAFPKDWRWFAEDLENEKIGDMPSSSGVVMSPRAFEVYRQQFNIQRFYPFEIDGHQFIWFQWIGVIQEGEEFDSTTPDIVVVKPRYIKAFSQRFVDLWKSNGFEGCEFIELTKDAQGWWM